MRILVATSDVPFVDGGHRVFARAVVSALCAAGHESEIWTTPTNRFGRQVSAYLANRLADVELTGDGLAVDALVSLRYPAFLVRHRHHRMWLTHLLREYYDLWDAFLPTLPRRKRLAERARRAVIRSWDGHALRGLERRFVISRTVQERLRRYLGIASDVLHPPPKERPYREEAYEDFILAPSRLHPLKRQELLLRGLARVPGCRAVVVGTGHDRERLEALSRDLGLASRVQFTGFASDEELCRLYARCRAVFFAPKDEDYGFITLEAFRSGKGVITCVDSGGPTELVAHGESGLVVEPDEARVAAALSEVMGDEGRARALGDAGRRRTADITWDRAIGTLLS